MSPNCGKVCPTCTCYHQSYRWTITNFTLKSQKKKIQSPVFSSKCCNVKYTGQLYLYPNGKRVEDEDYLSVFLYNRSNEIFTASVRFSILNKEHEILQRSSEIDEHQIAKNKSCGLYQFVKLSTIINDVLANNNTLVIACEIIYNDEEKRKKKLQTKMDELRVREFNMQEILLQDGQFSDVTFIIDDLRTDPLELHKCILAKSSSVLADMFELNPEKRTIEIEDVKYNVFIEVIWFMYVGKVEDITDMEGDVLAAADKYKVDGLKLLCEMALCDKLSVDNVFGNLRLAEVYGAEKLKTKAIEFIASNGEVLINKPEFQELPADVFYKICSALINQNND